eukprot:jgi/Ulvmu1/4016/UM188_0006.1
MPERTNASAKAVLSCGTALYLQEIGPYNDMQRCMLWWLSTHLAYNCSIGSADSTPASYPQPDGTEALCGMLMLCNGFKGTSAHSWEKLDDDVLKTGVCHLVHDGLMP